MASFTTQSVLRLNGNYQRLGWCSAQDAFTALMGENADGSPPALALDVFYNYDEYGMPITDKLIHFDPLDWEYWMLLDPRKGDLDRVIHTSKRIIRIPTIIVCPRYRKMPPKEERATPSAIRDRDGNICQYTGVPLTNKTFSLDHVIPKSKGGKDTWDNLVSAHKDFNSRKGNKLNSEIGAKLIKPIRPARVLPLSATVRENYHPDHEHFP